jgi:hypothetical protein
MSNIIALDNNGLAFATAEDIANYCEVNTRSVTNTIRDNVELFNQTSENIESKISLRMSEAMQLKQGLIIPRLKLEKSSSGTNIDWSKTKLYQPHVELLLMLMKNTKVVKQHKADLIAEFFITKFELFKERLKNQQLELDKANQALLLLEKKNKKLEADKFIDWEDEYSSVSRFIKDNKLDMTSTELLDLLEKAKQIETKQITTQVRLLTEESDGKMSKKGTLLFKKKLLAKLTNI